MSRAADDTPHGRLERLLTRPLVRLSTAGSVDDGKSTLIGRLLYDTESVLTDQLVSLGQSNGGEIDPRSLAFLTDGLRSEREQGITIDVAYRYFMTPHRQFILADSPGHERYTRNMATAASTANVTIVLIDAAKGILPQTKRHAFIAALLGVPRLVVAVNKMDLVDYSEAVFESIVSEFREFTPRLSVKEIRYLPVSALQGENIAERSGRMDWYRGESLLEYLDNISVDADLNHIDFRMPVQCVLRGERRHLAGEISSGRIRVGETILVLPSMKESTVTQLFVAGSPADVAVTPSSVSMTLADELDIDRGDMIVRPRNYPAMQTDLEAMMIWMDQEPMKLAKRYILRHTTRESRAHIRAVSYRVDVESLGRTDGQPLEMNEIGRVRLTATHPLFLDSYRVNRATGSILLIDPATFQTAAVGLVIDRMPDRMLPGLHAADLHSEETAVSSHERETRLRHRPLTIWFTGLSGSGKSTLAMRLERHLFDLGYLPVVLDGDNLRSRLNRDLGFTGADRTENIRRTAEVAALLNACGLIVLCSLISPLAADRQLARSIIGDKNFLEVYLSTPLDACEARDPHGLYRKARAGEIAEFTGVGSPYEPPAHPALTINTSALSIQDSLDAILPLIQRGRSYL